MTSQREDTSFTRLTQSECAHQEPVSSSSWKRSFLFTRGAKRLTKANSMAALTPPTVSEVKLTYRPKVRAADRPRIFDSGDTSKLLRQYWSQDLYLLEEFNILLVDRANRVIGFCNASKGGVTACIADAKIIFATALKARAVGIVLAHNHPSGQLRPSGGDIAITKKLVKGAKYLDMEVIDHIILAPEGGYYSFADDGLIYEYSQGD